MIFKKSTSAALVAIALSSLAAVTTPAAAADATKVFARFDDASVKTVDHTIWDGLLKKYVVAGDDGLNRVRYADFKQNDHAALKGYVRSLEGVNPAALARPEQFAYWANLYNAKTIDVVLDAYPVKSIKDITPKGGFIDFLKKSVGAGGPWKAKIMKVEGHELSLDDVEHNIMRAIFKDPRVHYAVNCASVGCPNLQRDAFTGEKLEAMLEAGGKAYVNSPRGFKVKAGAVSASSIYSWFQVDFGGNAKGVLDHAAKYAETPLKEKLAAVSTISNYEYDWSLNDAK